MGQLGEPSLHQHGRRDEEDIKADGFAADNRAQAGMDITYARSPRRRRQFDAHAKRMGTRKLAFETEGISVRYGMVYAAPENRRVIEAGGEGGMVARMSVPQGSNCLSIL